MMEYSAPARWRIPYWPRAERPRFVWPARARLAVWIVPNLEFYEYQPPRYDFRNQFPRAPHPDVMQYSFRDYGNRVGVWRMAEAFAQYPKLRITASTNLALFDHYPELAALVREANWCVMSHGIYNTRYLGRGTDQEERAFYRETIEATRRHTGQKLLGMLGPCVTNGPRTPELMGEAGLVYHADWVHDDIPVPLEAAGHRLVTIPYNYEINDAPLLEGHFDGPAFTAFNIDQFERLYAEAADGGLVYCLALHPYLIGQPHQIGWLRRLLDHLCAREAVWFATGDQIAQIAAERFWPSPDGTQSSGRPPTLAPGLARAAMAPSVAMTPSAAAAPAARAAPAPATGRGPDHPHHAWSALSTRRARYWPNGAGVALCPILSLETHEDEVPADWPQIAWLAGGVGLRPDPNIARIGARDYGLRIGVFRLLDALRSARLCCAVAIDALTAEQHPSLVALAREHGAEFLAHGLSVNRPLHDGLSESAERAYLAETKRRLAHCGIAPRGWFGVEYAESARTPPLVAAAGYDFLCDWCSDEQPFPMTVGGQELTALPLMADLDDAFCFIAPRGISAHSYAERLLEAATVLADEGRRQARVMIWHLRPFLSGQPFRMQHLAPALQRLAAIPGVWSASPSEIVDAWRTLPH